MKDGGERMGDEEFEFQNTELYQQIMEYINKIYETTKRFPKIEIYGLTNQIRRASVSIALNFAEGWGRYNKKEKSQFYKVARASIFECVAAIDISKRQNFIEREIYIEILNESNKLSKKFNGLIKSFDGG
ncbi:MAG: four helix bundle protein [Nitrospirota bacterium]